MKNNTMYNINKFRENPLRDPVDKTGVFVASGKGPYANTRRVLSYIDLSPLKGKRVLLKPNAGRVAAPGSGIVTHPEVIAAAIDEFNRVGAEVAVGESPIAGVKALEAFDRIGIGMIAAERGCPLIDLDAKGYIEVPIPDGIAIHTLKVCEDVFAYDIVVSMPVMKMHMHTGVTLSVKNMKGCLWKRSKVELHMLPPVKGYDEKSINIAIADMSSVLRPHLSIIDGTVGMEGLGPSAGNPKDLDVVIVSSDAFAADAVACRLMGTDAESIPHLLIGSGRHYGVIDISNIKITPDNWPVWASHFAPPPESLSIEFPNIDILDKNSCSACQSTLLLFLKRYGHRLFDYFPGQRVSVAIGKGNKRVPKGSLCIGNCTVRHRDKCIFIPGCPPVGSQILTAISGELSIDSEDGHILKKW